MKNKFIRKIVVCLASVILAGAAAGTVFAVKEAKEQAALEASYTEAKPVMTPEEMEELYDEHKQDANAEAAADEPLEAGEAVLEEGAEGTGTEEPSEGSGTKIYEGCPVDFEGMWEINEDVYAWITIPGTNIDYPILQHATDHSYYLNYNIDGSYGFPGCIYTENLNAKDFNDNNTLIYGHDLKAGTMFSQLHKYRDKAFFEENDKVYIYTPEKELTYTIFAAYLFDDRHLMYSFDFADREVYASYLDMVLNMRSLDANLREDVSVTAEDKIITLETCARNQPDKRLLVQAVLTQDSEGAE